MEDVSKLMRDLSIVGIRPERILMKLELSLDLDPEKPMPITGYSEYHFTPDVISSDGIVNHFYNGEDFLYRNFKTGEFKKRRNSVFLREHCINIADFKRVNLKRFLDNLVRKKLDLYYNKYAKLTKINKIEFAASILLDGELRRKTTIIESYESSKNENARCGSSVKHELFGSPIGRSW